MPSDYASAIESVKDKYEPRIREILEGLAYAFAAEGLAPDAIDDSTDEEYEWRFVAEPFDVAFTIVEERCREGGLGWGVSFDLRVHDGEGRLVAGISPFNYTPALWVDMRDEEGIEERFVMLEEADMAELAAAAVSYRECL